MFGGWWLPFSVRALPLLEKLLLSATRPKIHREPRSVRLVPSSRERELQDRPVNRVSRRRMPNEEFEGSSSRATVKVGGWVREFSMLSGFIAAQNAAIPAGRTTYGVYLPV